MHATLSSRPARFAVRPFLHVGNLTIAGRSAAVVVPALCFAYKAYMPWSDDVRVAFSPFRAYGELAQSEEARPALRALARVLFLLFVLGSFISITAAGRFVAFHVASTMLFWSFVAVIQAACFAGALRAVAPSHPRMPAIALYFAGHGPWMLFLTAVAGICLFAPDVRKTMTWLLAHGVLPLALLGTWVWSGVVTFACFRAGIGLSRQRAGAGTAMFYVSFVGIIVAWYLVTNQIQPQLPWAP